MKKIINLLPISLLTISSIATISSCSCVINKSYVAIPSTYLKIDNNKLIGFNDPEVDLTGFDTLQVPNTVTSVSGFNYVSGYKACKAIKYVIGDNSGKWTDIESSAFSSLPELTKIILPKTINKINEYAFVNLYKLDTIDLSNIEDISIIKANQFGVVDITKAITNGTIIVNNESNRALLTTALSTNDWLKGWTIKVK